MRRVQYYSYGPATAMQLDDYTLSPPEEQEVIVRVSAAAINPIDWKVRNGELRMVTGNSFPRALGSDFSGIITAIGARVNELAPGDEVIGMVPLKQSGAIAEFVVTTDSLIARKPTNLSHEEAACLPTPFVTAWNALIDKGNLHPGMSVFINGCSGAVGSAAAQLCQMIGANVAGSCSAEAFERMHKAGLAELHDYRSIDFSLLQRQFDMVLDASGHLGLAQGRQLLKRGGRFVDIHPTPAKFLQSVFNSTLKVVVCKPRKEILKKVAVAAQDGLLKTTVGASVPLKAAIDLLAQLENGKRLGGKGVVVMG
ncbi:NAD(P)-dependent alcohol dehydrogenase [Xanthomonas phaseoli pv. dieffenbachiae]|uniref:Alcohol dehydrogenase n=2 Tax=Xanthomonas TaxID=338 RepID=A0A1V9HBB4_9XANT|nr:NAD(P)-dependent alcohol dehydrogenase [Xanthomonas phaseoli]MBO9818491.1 NAD(P)-dependent alcohol dehydrogenase [Xanthomonas phaseoli pv. dieffenbachiae]OQP80143.1 alcohol dehydrogenase [Xanthomonas phaseoli pv. dieffenbachiae]